MIQHRRANLIESTATESTLALRLLETAEALAARGDRQQAVVVAMAAADVVVPAGSAVTPELANLRELGRVAATDHDEHADEALRLVHQFVADSYPSPIAEPRAS